MARIPILGHIDLHDDEYDEYRNYYYWWRQNNSLNKAPFLSLFKGFKEKELLKTLDEGALRLYLYFGFAADNDHGHSWHSIETIAKYFNKQTRTIDNWIRTLRDAGLIYRDKDSKKSHTTFLIPFTDTTIVQKANKKYAVDDQLVLHDALKKIQDLKELYGPIIRVYHVFHWGTDKKTKGPTTSVGSVNFLFVITQRPRPNDVLVGHMVQLKNSGDKGISMLDIEDVAVFKSPFAYDGKAVQGIAVKHSNRLLNKDKESFTTLMDFMRDLAKADDDALSQHPTVNYGLITDVLASEDPDDDDAGVDVEEDEPTQEASEKQEE